MGRPAISLLDRRFGRLVVVGQAVSTSRSRWRCRCDCGGSIVATSNTLANGCTKSCGCLFRETASANLRALHQAQRAGPAKQYGRQAVASNHDAAALSRALGYGG